MRPNIDASIPSSDDYKLSFEEYKILLDWTNSLASRRQETNNLFFGVDGALVTVVSLALVELTSNDQSMVIFFATVVGIIVSIVWLSLLQRYREILHFKYAQLMLFEEILGLDASGLVSAENGFFRHGMPLEAYGRKQQLSPPTKLGKFGITLAEINLARVFLAIFSIILIVTVF